MTPYYSDDAVTIYHGDCLDVLPTLSDIRLVFTSPPYNLRENGHKPSGSEWSALHDGYASYADDLPHAEYLEWQQTVLRGCWAALASDGAIFYNHKQITRGNQMTNPFDCIPPEIPVRQVLTWDRGDHGMQRSFWHYCPADEWVFLMAREGFRLSTLSMSSVWRVRPSRDDHPASFPLELPSRAIASTADGVVLDPFMGGGTTLRAAKNLGRRAIGIEISERYCEIAARRMGQEVLAL